MVIDEKRLLDFLSARAELVPVCEESERFHNDYQARLAKLVQRGSVVELQRVSAHDQRMLRALSVRTRDAFNAALTRVSMSAKEFFDYMLTLYPPSASDPQSREAERLDLEHALATTRQTLKAAKGRKRTSLEKSVITMEEALLDIAAETAVATDAMTRASTTDVSAFAKHRAEIERLRSPSMDVTLLAVHDGT